MSTRGGIFQSRHRSVMVASIWTSFISLMNRQADLTWPWSIRITSVPCRRTKFVAEPGSRARSHKNRLLSENSCLDVSDLFLYCCHYLNPIRLIFINCLYLTWSVLRRGIFCWSGANALEVHALPLKYPGYFSLDISRREYGFHLHLNSCIKLSSRDYTATRYRDFRAKRTSTSCT